jgi:hypothetical protein
MRARRIVLAAMTVLLLCNCAPRLEARVAKRITRVEHGLIRAYSDPPWKRMDLAERLLSLYWGS